LGDDPGQLKAVAYLHQANHGQFNSLWGDRDRQLYNSLLLNRAPLLDQDAQQQAAKALITSFLHASLRDEAAYRAPFGNPATGNDRLPAGVVVTQLRGAASIVLEDFEGQAPGPVRGIDARIDALLLRDGEREQGNQALRLAWAAGTRAAFEVAVAPEDAVRAAAGAALTFALAAVPGAAPPSEVVVELVAADGAIARHVLGAGGPLVHPLPAHLVKARWLYGLNGFPGDIRPEEVVLQTFTVPLAAFEGTAVEPADLTSVRFAFAGDEGGAVYLDEVALTGE
jgi:hypothetical protein